MIQTTEITKAIKFQLKKKGLTYQDLANRIGVSVSGLKKILSSKDLSFGRIQEMSTAIGIDFVDLINEINQPRISEGKFSDEIESYFVKNPKKFDFYWLLTVERVALNDIGKKWKMTESELYKILREFDQLGLIEWREKDVIKLPPRKMTTWVGKGPLTEKIQRQWATDLIDDHYQQNESNSSTYRLRYLKLTKKTLIELQSALEQLELEFLERSFREQTLEVENLVDARLFLCLNDGSFVKRSQW